MSFTTTTSNADTLSSIAKQSSDDRQNSQACATLNNQILTAHQVAADFFQGLVSYDKVLRMTKAGDLPCLPIPNRYLYRRDFLEAWAQNRSDPNLDLLN